MGLPFLQGFYIINSLLKTFLQGREQRMKCLYGECPSREVVRKERKNGINMGEIRLGEHLLVHRYFFHTKCIRYTDIVNAYLMTEVSEGGDFAHEEMSLCIGDPSGKVWRLHADYKAYVMETLDWFREHQPHIRIGK